MNNLKKHLKMTWMMMKMSAKSQFTYMGWSAPLSYVAQIIQFVGHVGVIWITMRMFDKIGEFSMWEVFILYSMQLLSYAIATSFLQPFWNIKNLILHGEMDFYLIRPVDPLYYIMSKGYVPGYTAHIIVAIFMLILSLFKLGLLFNLFTWVVIIIATIFGIGIQFGIRVIPSLLTFWWGNVSSIQFLSFYFGDMSRYPITIFPMIVRIFMVFVYPYAFINYFPSLLALRKIETGKGILLLLLCGLVSFLMVFVTRIMFKNGLKKYESGNG